MPADSDLVAYLDTQLTETAGTDLFEGPLGESPSNAIGVTCYASEPTDDRVMASSLTAPGSEIVRVQVMARNTSKANAQTRAAAAYAALDNLQNASLSGRTYFWVEGQGEPFCIGQDQNLLWAYVCNFRVRKTRG